MVKKLKLLVFSRLIFLVMRLLKLTYRFEKIDEDNYDQGAKLSFNGTPLTAIWHENSVAIILGETGRKYRPLVSRSSSGRMAAFTLERLGYWPAFGSASRGGKKKGGKEVRQEIIETLDKGFTPSFTVDGSIGPRRKCKAGIVYVAEKSGIPIVPLAAIAERAWVLNTWDKMQIPKPFSRILLVYGAPILVPKGTIGEQFTRIQEQIDDSLNEGEKKGLKLLGLPPDHRYSQFEANSEA